MEFFTVLLTKRKLDPKLINLQTNIYILIGFTTLTYFLLSRSVVEKYHIKDSGGNYTSVGTDSTSVEIFVPQCDCSKWISVNKSLKLERKVTLNDTTCSSETFKRGFEQKIIGFTFYEPDPDNGAKNNRNYFDGISENLKLMTQFYPGYVMRLYYQAQEPKTIKELCKLSCSNSHLDLCDVSSNPKLGNSTILYPLLWRFLPVLDAQVDYFFSRDLDSRISPREASAVQEFLSSEQHSFHVMRDHPAHSAYVMGGTWGIKVNKHRKELKKSLGKLFKDKSGLAYIDRNLGGYDQVALTKYIWPWAKWTALSHDSYLCKKYSRTSPFPTRREDGIGNYVGSVVSLNASLQLGVGSECPVKCRPKHHKDWIYC